MILVKIRIAPILVSPSLALLKDSKGPCSLGWVFPPLCKLRLFDLTTQTASASSKDTENSWAPCQTYRINPGRGPGSMCFNRLCS